MGEQLPRVGRERLQQRPLRLRQMHVAVAPRDAVRLHVDRHAVEPVPRRARRRGPLAAAQQRADPREQLARAERLRQVVVGPEVQRGDLVGLLVAHRQDDDRHAAPRTDPPAELEPVEHRHVEIEDHEVGRRARPRGRAPRRRRRRARPRSRARRATARSPRGSAARRRRRGSCVTRPPAARTRRSRPRRGCPRARSPRPSDRRTPSRSRARGRSRVSWSARRAERRGRNSWVRSRVVSPAPWSTTLTATCARRCPWSARTDLDLHRRAAGGHGRPRRVVQEVRQHPREEDGVGDRDLVPVVDHHRDAHVGPAQRRRRRPRRSTVSARSTCSRLRLQRRRPRSATCRGGSRRARRAGRPRCRPRCSTVARSAVVRSTSGSSRSVTDALIAARGLRRSCETAASMLRRAVSVCRKISASVAARSSRSRSSTSASWSQTARRTRTSAGSSAGRGPRRARSGRAFGSRPTAAAARARARVGRVPRRASIVPAGAPTTTRSTSPPSAPLDEQRAGVEAEPRDDVARAARRYVSSPGPRTTRSRLSSCSVCEARASLRLGGLRALHRSREEERDQHRQRRGTRTARPRTRARAITNVSYGGRKKKLKARNHDDRRERSRARRPTIAAATTTTRKPKPIVSGCKVSRNGRNTSTTSRRTGDRDRRSRSRADALAAPRGAARRCVRCS